MYLIPKVKKPISIRVYEKKNWTDLKKEHDIMQFIEKKLKKLGITYDQNNGMIFGYEYTRGHPEYDFFMLFPSATHTLVQEWLLQICPRRDREYSCIDRADKMAGSVVCALCNV